MVDLETRAPKARGVHLGNLEHVRGKRQTGRSRQRQRSGAVKKVKLPVVHELFLDGSERVLAWFTRFRLPGTLPLALKFPQARVQQFRSGDVHRLAATRAVVAKQLKQFLIEDDLQKTFVFFFQARTTPALRIP